MAPDIALEPAARPDSASDVYARPSRNSRLSLVGTSWFLQRVVSQVAETVRITVPILVDEARQVHLGFWHPAGAA